MDVQRRKAISQERAAAPRGDVEAGEHNVQLRRALAGKGYAEQSSMLSPGSSSSPVQLKGDPKGKDGFVTQEEWAKQGKDPKAWWEEMVTRFPNAVKAHGMDPSGDHPMMGGGLMGSGGWAPDTEPY